jgi:hypothetical protein
VGPRGNKLSLSFPKMQKLCNWPENSEGHWKNQQKFLEINWNIWNNFMSVFSASANNRMVKITHFQFHGGIVNN